MSDASHVRLKSHQARNPHTSARRRPAIRQPPMSLRFSHRSVWNSTRRTDRPHSRVNPYRKFVAKERYRPTHRTVQLDKRPWPAIRLIGQLVKPPFLSNHPIDRPIVSLCRINRTPEGEKKLLLALTLIVSILEPAFYRTIRSIGMRWRNRMVSRTIFLFNTK